ncbi:calcium-binding protein [Thalassovita sp.]|uniref:calcium-binding protein n=1 Tax=Thalassovita sp. TaxID=1979401 RepID=UPI0029DE8E52|nr:calcium-binding protein [Thalassovita sp.]
MDIFSIEVFDNHIKIEFVDGSVEEIDGGQYEAKDADGKTQQERVATQADFDRLAALGAEFEANLPPIEAEVIEVTNLAGVLEVKYADGTKEEIENGVYERKNSDNDTIVERAADQTDIDRLTALIDGPGAPGGDDGTPDQGPGDAPGTGTPGDDDGTPDQGSGDAPGTATVPGGGQSGVQSGGAGDDTLTGGDGKDKIRVGAGDDEIDGADGNDRLLGQKGNDTLSGGNGNDRLKGHSGDDSLDGGDGNDRLKGNGGDDTLDGGNGSDHYHGGQGADVFIFAPDGAVDKIHDYEDGIDLIDVSAYGFSGVADFLSTATEEGGDVYIELAAGDVLIIDDTSLVSLGTEDFLL